MRLVLFPVLALAVAIGGCHRQAPPAPQATVEPTAQAAPAPPPAQASTANKGKAMPATPFEGPDGKPAKLADFKGKPVLVNFWATWCVPCVRELPTLDTLAQARAGKLTVLTISQDMEGRAKIDAFWKAHGFTGIKPWLDKSNALMLATKEVSLPVSILYGADGREVWRLEGDLDWSGAKAKALLAQAGV